MRNPEEGEQNLDEIRQLALTAAHAAAEKKGQDIVLLEVGSVLSITDLFVITSASNSRSVKTIVEEIEKQVKAAGGPSPLHTEGLEDGQWVLLDYGDIVVHVFLDEVRRYYDLERLWRDMPRVAYEGEAPVGAAAE